MQKNSILNYFSRTPNSSPSAAGTSSSANTGTVGQGQAQNGSASSASASVTTPKSGKSNRNSSALAKTPTSGKSNRKSSAPVTTPTSGKSNMKNSVPATTPTSGKSNMKSNGSDDSRKNKRPSSTELTTSPSTNGNAAARSTKRIRTDETSPGKEKEYFDGDVVWAKLEGYPWWPGFVTPHFGKEVSQDNLNEFHVQFFDNPPSRAWIRKPDLKLYKGSTDGAVPPAKSDPSWVDACKTADKALTIPKSKRTCELGVDFDNEEDVIKPPIRKETVKNEIKNGSSDNVGSKSKRRRRIIIESSESSEEEIDEGQMKHKTTTKKDVQPKTEKMVKSKDEEYQPDDSIQTIESESESDPAPSSEVQSEEETPPRTEKSKKKSVLETPTSTSNTASVRTPARQLDFKAKVLEYSKSPKSCSARKPEVSTSNSEEGRWPHLKLDWLKPKAVRDKKMRGKDHPDYDPNTLHVPKHFLESLTPAVRQWWEMKSDNFDCIIFFKLGKFYEMYHMDAVTGVEELGLIFMKGDLAHCGFPESGYSRYSELLVQKGYKVARVEQTETPDMMNERCKSQFKPTKFDKVVKREICQFTTQGVRVASVQDVAGLPFQPNSEYLFAIIERQHPNEFSEFGVCFIDTTIGTFHIGQFKDDRHCSRLRTLFAHYTPVEIVHEKKNKGSLSTAALQLLNNMSGIRKNSLISETEFFGAHKTLKVLAEGSYFRKTESDPVQWPESLKRFQSEADTLGLTPEPGWELGIKCLGAVIFYLTKCLVEHDLLSLGQFEVYVPVDSVLSPASAEKDKPALVTRRSKFMVLDAVTLRNLEITQGPKNLLSLLDRCSTQFGKRLLRQWTCAPLATQEGISERQNAIEELMTLQDLREQIIPMLKSLMDLERLLNKVHSLGSQHHSQSHPDSRAIMFEEKKYSKRKIYDLTSILKNFKTCVSLITLMNGSSDGINSTLLQSVISEFPSLDKLLDFFDKAFNHKTALEEGKIIPVTGVDQEYDSTSKDIVMLTKETNSYLKEMQDRFHRQVKYFGSEKKRFQLEMPESVRVPNDFEMSSSRKGFKRYHSSKTKEFLAKMIQLETTRDVVLKDITRRIFAQFDKHREIWRKAVSCVGTLDVLLSLTTFSESQENMCRPNVISSTTTPFINIENGRHPSLSQDTYIPNDSKLGVDSESAAFLLLTGPNMGGKSTLMRQIGIITVIAQIGCYVPATKCDLSIVDRIFTRLGANDNIGDGESTFFVELSETSAVLQHSTRDSLVLMDELGRGTATYDGTAIAYAVAKALAKVQCRTIFSTHYHTLVESLQNETSIQLGHMACMVENENEDDPTEETITFLYKLAPGACPKSYGFNAAKLAGIPTDVIRLASKKAKELERKVKRAELFRNICSTIGKKSFTLQDWKLMKVA